ncbi:MAG TPA: PhzF family phenazine biosynthesis protein, partial [Polyangiaceae bacterium LLY-WYZ-15_(1-7)]|nr:PhzF family phenazine biosynthesis protein [Polyangiaceae bacterium LLY-WYZ-15_(1-7)]
MDAFVDAAGAFTGNPAAVCLLPAGATPSDGWRQAVAAEMNLSETA